MVVTRPSSASFPNQAAAATAGLGRQRCPLQGQAVRGPGVRLDPPVGARLLTHRCPHQRMAEPELFAWRRPGVRGPARRPRPGRQGPVASPRVLAPQRLSTRGQVSWIQPVTVSSSRSAARRAGTCTVHHPGQDAPGLRRAEADMGASSDHRGDSGRRPPLVFHPSVCGRPLLQLHGQPLGPARLHPGWLSLRACGPRLRTRFAVRPPPPGYRMTQGNTHPRDHRHPRPTLSGRSS